MSTYRAQFFRTLRAAQPRRTFHTTGHAQAGDPYSTLGVGKQSSAADIKKAYYALAKKYHPDSSKEANAKEKFVEVQSAYDVLSDAKKRSLYDKYGAASLQPGFDPAQYEFMRGGGGAAGGFPGFGSFHAGGAADFDLFGAMFGSFGGGGRGPRAQAQPRVGRNLHTTMRLSFAEAVRGAKKTVTVKPLVNCGTCDGAGTKKNVQRQTCQVCHGSGMQIFELRQGFAMQSTCEACHGRGTVIPPGGECGSCHGSGRVRETKTIQLDFPAGIDTDQTLQVDGLGDMPTEASARGQSPGDLLVTVVVEPSKVFTRSGANVACELGVPFTTAILGGDASVPNVDPTQPGHPLTIDPGTQPDKQFVLRGKGIRRLNAPGNGDLVVNVRVDLPTQLTPEQRELIEKFAVLQGAAERGVDPSDIEMAERLDKSPGMSSQAGTTTSGDRKSSKWWAGLEEGKTADKGDDDADKGGEDDGKKSKGFFGNIFS